MRILQTILIGLFLIGVLSFISANVLITQQDTDYTQGTDNNTLSTDAKKELLIDIHPILIPENFTPDIIIMDSLTAITAAFSGEEYRFRIYMEQLFRYLEANKITAFLITETPVPTHTGFGSRPDTEAVSFLSDGIISIYNVFYKTGLRDRAIEIVKMRGENINRKIVRMELTSQGITVYPRELLKGEFTLT
jgi:KaiC/GvpD/RAD55 family RecA-like ATPase